MNGRGGGRVNSKVTASAGTRGSASLGVYGTRVASSEITRASSVTAVPCRDGDEPLDGTGVPATTRTTPATSHRVSAPASREPWTRTDAVRAPSVGGHRGSRPEPARTAPTSSARTEATIRRSWETGTPGVGTRTNVP